MILTHLIQMEFVVGAGTQTIVTAGGPLCFEAVQCVSPWVQDCEPSSPWVVQVEPSSPWIEEVQPGCP